MGREDAARFAGKHSSVCNDAFFLWGSAEPNLGAGKLPLAL